MTGDNQLRRLLRMAALSTALLLTAGPVALADPANLALNPATADYAAYFASRNRDIHPNQITKKDQVPGCEAQCAAGVQAIPREPEDAFSFGAR